MVRDLRRHYRDYRYCHRAFSLSPHYVPLSFIFLMHVSSVAFLASRYGTRGVIR